LGKGPSTTTTRKIDGVAVEFRGEFERAKAINLELRSRIALAAGEMPPVSIFDGPIEGFAADSE
jgi:hypothetical protein